MTRMQKIHRSGLTAIAAVLALSSTPALAQDASPFGATDPLAPTPEAATPLTTPSTSQSPSAAAPVIETPLTIPLAEEPAPAEASPIVPEVSEPVATPAPAEPEVATPATEAAPVAAKNSAPARSAPVAPSTPVADAVAAPVTDESAAVIDETGAIGEMEALPALAAPTETQPAQSKEASGLSAILPIASVAILGLLGLIVAARLLRRRKPVEADAPVAVAHEGVTPVAASTKSPMAKGAFHAAKPGIAQPMPAGGPSVEAAYAGPTPDNPSLSLKHRLKRASFFAQRQRLAAMGKASPLSRFAGLPKRVVEEMRAAGRGFAPQPQMAH